MGSQTTFVHVHEPIFVVEACFGVNICFCGPASLGPYQYSRGCEQRQQNPLYPGRHIILTLWIWSPLPQTVHLRNSRQNASFRNINEITAHLLKTFFMTSHGSWVKSQGPYCVWPLSLPLFSIPTMLGLFSPHQSPAHSSPRRADSLCSCCSISLDHLWNYSVPHFIQVPNVSLSQTTSLNAL